jgi:hypothetical protein
MARLLIEARQVFGFYSPDDPTITFHESHETIDGVDDAKNSRRNFHLKGNRAIFGLENKSSGVVFHRTGLDNTEIQLSQSGTIYHAEVLGYGWVDIQVQSDIES